MAKKKSGLNKPMKADTSSASTQPIQDTDMSEDTTTENGAADETTPASTPSADTQAPATDTTTTEAPAEAPAPASAPAPAPAESPVAPAAPAPAAPAAAAPTNTLQLSDVASGILAGLRDRADQYVKAMSRSMPMNAAKGARMQLDLYRLILDILRQEGPVFMKAWSDFLAVVHEHSENAFSEPYAYRFINEIAALSAAERRSFINLLHLALVTADPKSRGLMLRSVDMKSVTANIPLPNAADKLISFYSP